MSASSCVLRGGRAILPGEGLTACDIAIENGKIAEHWDSVPKDKNMVKRDPNQGAKPKQ